MPDTRWAATPRLDAERLARAFDEPPAVEAEPLEGYDRRTRGLLGRIREVGDDRDTADGDDSCTSTSTPATWVAVAEAGPD